MNFSALPLTAPSSNRSIESKQTEIDELQKRHLEMEAAAVDANQQLASLRQRREESAQKSSQHLAHVATLEERQRSAAAVVGRIEALAAEMAERVGSLQTADRIIFFRKNATRSRESGDRRTAS